jgi:hypothetical protein
MWLSGASPSGTRPFHCLPLSHSGACILAPSEKKTLPETVYCLGPRRYFSDRGANSPVSLSTVMIMWQTPWTFALGNATSGVLEWFKRETKHFWAETIIIWAPYVFLILSLFVSLLCFSFTFLTLQLFTQCLNYDLYCLRGVAIKFTN